MTSQNLKQLIAQGENQTVEFKTSLNLKQEIGETISALASTTGGVILIGVSDDGTVRGVQMGKKTSEDLAHFIRNNTDPQIYPEIQEHHVEGKTILAICVKENDIKPVFFKGFPFQRVGKTNQRMSVTRIRELAQQERVRWHWDEKLCDRATLFDLDEEKVRWFLRQARRERNLDIDPDIPIQEALERLELTRNGLVTNAAVLLFGKQPQRFFLIAETRCGRFEGIEPVKPFLDMKVFGGSLIDQVDAAVDFTLRHTSMAAWIEAGKLDRQERWEYPPQAIREAIVNAICHRQYDVSSHVQVRIFNDRIEVWGCGTLPKPLTPADLTKTHKSVLRNPLIGKCFFLMKLIEQWGTGTNDMIKLCRGWGLPDPLFEEITGSLVVTFRKYHLPNDLDKFGLNERQRKAIELMREQGQMKLGELKALYPDVTERTLRRDLAELQELELIQAVGEKRGRRYVLQAGGRGGGQLADAARLSPESVTRS